MHVDDQITRKKFASGLTFLAAFDFRNALRGNEYFENHVPHFLSLDPFLDIIPDLVLLAR